MKKITKCRACGSKALTPAFSLPSGSNAAGRRQAPSSVDFVFCDPARDVGACGLLQAAGARPQAAGPVQPSGLYAVTRSHLRQLATESLEMISGRDCAAFDIGCNDGTLMSFYPRWVERYGADPSDIIEDIGQWAWTAQSEFPSEELDAALGAKKFDIITAASVLETIDKPRTFLARVKERLADDGVFALETLYAPMALTRTAVEPVIGGAAAVYSLGVLERLARDLDLKIFRGALTDKDGGSIRLYMTHSENEDFDFDPWYERLARLWDEENALALRANQPYQAFEQRARDARQAFEEILSGIQGRSETAHLLGTGPHSTALLTWAGGAAQVISAAVADAGSASGESLPLPLISETASRAAEPDYLIAPAALKREMMERWRESILLGAKMIIPSPAPHIIHTHNYASELGKALATGDGAGSVETLRAILGAAGGLRLIGGVDASQRASG